MCNVERYRGDCKRIQEVARKNGYTISLKQAAEVWARHSDDFAANWLIIDSDKEVEMALDNYSKELKGMKCPHCGGSLEKDEE